jgi:hypothetical protein
MEHSTCRVWSWPLLAWRKRLHKYGENSATMRITLPLPQTVKVAGSASELVMWQFIVSALAECESEDQKTSRGWREHPTTGRTRSDQRPPCTPAILASTATEMTYKYFPNAFFVILHNSLHGQTVHQCLPPNPYPLAVLPISLDIFLSPVS